MTSRSKNAARGYETEIEKCREEANWKKAIELALLLKTRSPQHESLAHFLIGEGKLEDHLEEYPPVKDNMQLAQSQLGEARGYLSLATDEAGKKAGVALDAHLLLGKLNYACGSYEEALKHFRLAELHTLTEKELPIRSLRIVAESYAIKALCLEETGVTGPSSKYKQAEHDADMTRSFETSSSLTLLYLQRTSAVRAGAVLEAAVQRAPRQHLLANQPLRALERYREMLSAVECQWTQALRLSLSRQLAELLMRGAIYRSYVPPQRTTLSSQQGTLTRRIDDGSSGPWKPKKYAAINQFVPANIYEECALVVLVGEALAVRGAVLSQSAEFQQARGDSLRHVCAMQDLLAMLAARYRQIPLLLESLERAMKFSFNSAHVWRQRALASAAVAPPAGDHVPDSPSWSAGVKAMSVLRHAKGLSPDDAPLRLVGAQTCYNMGELEEGVKMAEEALAIQEKSKGPMLARCHLFVGIGYQTMAQKTNARPEKESHQAISEKHLVTSARLDPRDHLAFYHLAVHYMQQACLTDAMEAARACLAANVESAEGLRLLIALSAHSARALPACALARLHYPRAAWPLAARALPQLLWEGQEPALTTAKELLTLLNTTTDVEIEQIGYAELDALSDSQHEDFHSNRDAASIRAESTGVYRMERALSETADSVSPKGNNKPLQTRKAQAWLLVAELCLRIGRISAAAGCVAEAAALTPYSHLVLYTVTMFREHRNACSPTSSSPPAPPLGVDPPTTTTRSHKPDADTRSTAAANRGLVHEASGEWEEARDCFRNAVALHPTHLDSLVHLGTAYYETGWVGLAESVLRAAAALEPARAGTWRRLARVLAARGEPAAAADAAAAALALHPHLPSLSN